MSVLLVWTVSVGRADEIGVTLPRSGTTLNGPQRSVLNPRNGASRSTPYNGPTRGARVAQLDGAAPGDSELLAPPARTMPPGTSTQPLPAPEDFDVPPNLQPPRLPVPGASPSRRAAPPSTAPPSGKTPSTKTPGGASPSPNAAELAPGSLEEVEGVFDPPPGFHDGVLYLDDPEGAGYIDEYYDGRPWQLFHGLYVRGEYLLWTTSGMYVPPLVTTSTQTTRPGAGALGNAATTILFGGTELNELMHSGGRLTVGTWLEPSRRLGIEGDYFGLADETTSFLAGSNGAPILARPFFNMLTGRESAELVAFPNVISGTVSVDATTQFEGAGARLRWAACMGCGCDASWCDPCGSVDTGYRMSLLAGYRYLRLNDRLQIHEQLTTLDVAGGTFDITDTFATENRFHGGDVGAMAEFRRGRWSLELLAKIALGVTHETADIRGRTVITDNGVETVDSGILALQNANVGAYSRDVFSVVPELGLTAGFQLSPHLRATLGATFLYWSRVARAGNQIDLDVNPNLFPPDPTLVGPLRPRFAFVDSDFWALGMNVGLEGRW